MCVEEEYMDYHVVYQLSSNITEACQGLAREVDEWQKLGYQVQGGVSVAAVPSSAGDGYIYRFLVAQAMIRER